MLYDVEHGKDGKEPNRGSVQWMDQFKSSRRVSVTV